MNAFTYILIGLLVLFILYVGGYTTFREFIIEKPKYQVLEKKKGYEIREYAAYTIASYTREGGGINSGFRQVAGYIFGDNKGSEKIAMTSPVIDTPNADTRTTSFVLPSEYTLEDLPEPNNPDLVIKDVPAAKWAVMRFSVGPYNEDKLQARLDQLSVFVDRDELETTGEYQFAFYDPPGLVWPFRRDEVWIKLK